MLFGKVVAELKGVIPRPKALEQRLRKELSTLPIASTSMGGRTTPRAPSKSKSPRKSKSRAAKQPTGNQNQMVENSAQQAACAAPVKGPDSPNLPRPSPP